MEWIVFVAMAWEAMVSLPTTFALVTWGWLGIITFFGWIVAAYWLPTLIAHERRSNRHTTVAVINLFGGWVFGIGWIVALIIALASSPRGETSRA